MSNQNTQNTQSVNFTFTFEDITAIVKESDYFTQIVAKKLINSQVQTDNEMQVPVYFTDDDEQMSDALKSLKHDIENLYRARPTDVDSAIQYVRSQAVDYRHQYSAMESSILSSLKGATQFVKICHPFKK
jgi:hypothetical protein